MDIQLKKGLLEVCILRSINYGDSYGYKIVKGIPPVIDISESTLYPVLKRLEISGLVTVYSEEHNNRLRKYYQLTEEGRKKIRELIENWADVTKVFKFIKGVRDDGQE